MDLENLEIQDIEEEEEEMQLRAPKRYTRDAQNPFEFYNEFEFKRRFRFSKDSVMYDTLPLIEEGLAKINNRGLPIPLVMQLLVCLRFYQQVFSLFVGDVITISQPTISRIIFRVSTLIARYINRYIKIPKSDEARSENKRLFKEMGHGPGEIGFPSIEQSCMYPHSSGTYKISKY